MTNLIKQITIKNNNYTQEVINQQVKLYERLHRSKHANLVVNADTITFTLYSRLSYENLVVQLIRKQYSLNEELAILRQRDTKPSEFNAYNSYVETCKTQAKEFINQRNSVLGV